MQVLPKAILVAAVVALVTPALALAAASERAGAARKGQIEQESTAARRQAAAGAHMSLVKQMQGNNDPALRVQLIRQQMQGGK